MAAACTTAPAFDAVTSSSPQNQYPPRSPQGLAARWVQWAATPSFFRSPIADTSGARGGLHQPDDVWFLAGSYGGDPVVRHLVVPPRRELFFPVFTMWFVDQRPEVVEQAFGTLSVDGVDTAVDVVATHDPFVVRGGFLNGVNRSRRPVWMSVWGLWGSLSPLGAGQHEVAMRGGDGHGFVVDVTYRLDVRGTA